MKAPVQVCVLLAALLAAGSVAAAPAPISISVDVTDAPRKVFHSHMVFPVKPGPLTLLYPKYIPGEHGPTGPLADVAGLVFRVDGKKLAWRRDLVDMYTIRLEIPRGAHSLTVDMDFLSPTGEGAFTAGVSATPALLDLNWNQVALYPAGIASKDLTYQPSLKLPAGWQYATALETRSRAGGTVLFAPVTFNNLVDSPVIAGRHFRQVDLAPGATPPNYLDIVADEAVDLDISSKDIKAHRNLVKEAGALFGSHHYRNYHFLLTLSDHTAHFGLEHHQSSDDRTDADLFTNPEAMLVHAGLLPHEFVHSWNGKFRRPADLTTPDFEKPMKTDLLWVYEGLTEYLGDVLTARSGLWSAQDYREALAFTAANMDHVPGREWRPLQDTADEAQVLYETSHAWANYRRRTDFYPEGELLWLDVDTKIRELSRAKRSIDDFCHAFYGMDDGSYITKPYTFDELVATLNTVQPYDWASFLRTRLDAMKQGAPLDGITRGGWKLAYSDSPTPFFKATAKVRSRVDERFSIGMGLNEGGVIDDVIWDSPAFKAGLGAGMKLIAVNGRKFTPAVFEHAIAAAKTDKSPIELLVENEDYYKTYKVDYHGGLKYPYLVREKGVPDRLSKIIAPHAE